MMVRRLPRLLLAAVVAAAGCSSFDSVPPPTPIPQQPECRTSHEPQSLCVIVLGDSLAAGTPLSGGDRWWVRLQSDLSAALLDRQVTVENWAVPGSRVDVLEAAARDQPALESYDVAIVIEGVNDEGWMPLAEWRSRYEAAVLQMEERGIRVVIGTPPPSLEDGAFMSRYDATAAALREVAGSSRALIDVAGRWRADGAEQAAAYYVDLIHQGSAGQQLMAEMARDVVLRLVNAS